MTNSVYIVGGAGTGKSTFTAQLLEDMGGLMGPLHDLHSLRNAKALVTLRGHDVLAGDMGGMYLGCMRDEFPGTDGLDRASSPVGEAWLQAGFLPDFIISEGATLATRRFVAALHDYTNLLLVHLHVDDFVKELRFAERGSNQDPSFVLSTETRSSNLVKDMEKYGVSVLDLDSSDPVAWDAAKQACETHLIDN